MTESPQTAAPKANGLSTLLNVIAAPKEAFETLKVAPTWGWAAIIAIVLILIGQILFQPASQHASLGFVQHLTSGPAGANMSDAQKQAALDRATHPSAVNTMLSLFFSSVVMPFIACLLNALLLLLANVIGKGTSNFKSYFSSSWNVLIPSFALAQLATGLIAYFRGADSFSSFADLFRIIPSLAWVGPQHGWALGFCGAISIFSLWGLYLNATSLKIMGGVKSGIAWTISGLILVLMAASLGLATILA